MHVSCHEKPARRIGVLSYVFVWEEVLTLARPNPHHANSSSRRFLGAKLSTGADCDVRATHGSGYGAHIPKTHDCPNSKPRGHWVWPEIKWPLRVSWYCWSGSGIRRYGDFNEINLPFGLVVGERVRKLVEENELKGFVFRKIRMVKHRPLREQAFAPEEVQGKFWVLDADLTLSLSFGRSNKMEVKRMCDVCGWTEVAFPRKGKLSVEADGWDGHDAFRIRYLDLFAVSSRFRKLVRAAKLTLIDFEPLSDLGSAEAREEFKGPVSKREEEFLRENVRMTRILEEFNATGDWCVMDKYSEMDDLFEHAAKERAKDNNRYERLRQRTPAKLAKFRLWICRLKNGLANSDSQITRVISVHAEKRLESGHL